MYGLCQVWLKYCPSSSEKIVTCRQCIFTIWLLLVSPFDKGRDPSFLTQIYVVSSLFEIGAEFLQKSLMIVQYVDIIFP